MPRPYKPKMLTANHLLSGEVIYLTAELTWSKDPAEALLFRDQHAASEALQQAERQPDLLVGAYLADAIQDGRGKTVPVHIREILRAKGPSNYRHGKQAEPKRMGS